jgi:hypothetical protein
MKEQITIDVRGKPVTLDVIFRLVPGHILPGTDRQCSYVEITLDEKGCRIADWIANRRNGQAKKKRRKVKYGQDPEATAQDDRAGAHGELAVAVLTGFSPWWSDEVNTSGAGHDPDVGSLQVRTRKHHHYDRLLIQPDDPKDAAFIHCTTELDSLDVVRLYGWSLGAWVQRQEFWGDHFGKGRPCFALPQVRLHDLLTLPGDGMSWVRIAECGIEAQQLKEEQIAAKDAADCPMFGELRQ